MYDHPLLKTGLVRECLRQLLQVVVGEPSRAFGGMDQAAVIGEIIGSVRNDIEARCPDGVDVGCPNSTRLLSHGRFRAKDPSHVRCCLFRSPPSQHGHTGRIESQENTEAHAARALTSQHGHTGRIESQLLRPWDEVVRVAAPDTMHAIGVMGPDGEAPYTGPDEVRVVLRHPHVVDRSRFAGVPGRLQGCPTPIIAEQVVASHQLLGRCPTPAPHPERVLGGRAYRPAADAQF